MDIHKMALSHIVATDYETMITLVGNHGTKIYGGELGPGQRGLLADRPSGSLQYMRIVRERPGI